MLTLYFSGQSLYKCVSVQLNDRSLVGSIEDALKLMSLILFLLSKSRCGLAFNTYHLRYPTFELPCFIIHVVKKEDYVLKKKNPFFFSYSWPVIRAVVR